MIKYLTIKRRKKIIKKDGKRTIEMSFVEKEVKRGKIISQYLIKKRHSILVCGKASSGKTRWLRRVADISPEFWRKSTCPPLLLSADDPIAHWREKDEIIEWWNNENPDKEWRKLSSHRKNKLILDYVSKNWVVVLIDNADRLTGRKLDIIKEILTESQSKIFVCSAVAENRINPSLRNLIIKSRPQTFTLNSPVAYDITNPLVGIACIFFVIIGWYPAAIALGGMRMLGKGMFSTKQQ